MVGEVTGVGWGNSGHQSIYHLDSLGTEQVSSRCHYISRPRTVTLPLSTLQSVSTRPPCLKHSTDRGAVTEAQGLETKGRERRIHGPSGAAELTLGRFGNASWLPGTLTNLSSPLPAGQSQRPTGMKANENVGGPNLPKPEGRKRPAVHPGLPYRAKLGCC